MPRPRRKHFLLVLAAAVAIWAVPPALWLRPRVQADLTVLNNPLSPERVGDRERVLLVSPHLDDETLGAGGLLAHLAARKIPTRVVFLSNGDGSGSTILALNFRHGRRFSFVESAKIRQKEAVAALGKLGLSSRDAVFLGYPDGDLQTMWDRWNQSEPITSRFTGLSRVPYPDAPGAGSEFRGANIERDLRRAISDFAPTRVLSTHGADTHPDHWSADAFARLALQVLAAQPRAASVTHQGFVIHHGLFPLPHGSCPSERLGVPAPLLEPAGGGSDWRDFALSPREQEAKRAALEEYSSQLVFTPHYLRAFVRRNEPLGHARNFSRVARWPDESAESWALARRAAADLRGVEVLGHDARVRIRVALAASPTPGVTYALSLKAADGSGRIVARRFDARLENGALTAREATTEIAVPCEIVGNGFEVSVGREVLGGARRVVIDASTWSGAAEGGAMCDRTESRAVWLG